MLTDSSDRNLKRAAYLAIAINFTYYLARACSKKYVLGLATLYSNSGVVAGFVYSLYTIAQLAAALVVGRLADKHGNKPPLISGAALMTAGATIVAFSGGLFPVAAGNILLGAAHGLILTASQAVVVSVRDSYEKSKLAGYFYFSNSLGGFAGGVVGGYLQAWDNHLGFLGAAAIAAITLAFTLVMPNIRGSEGGGDKTSSRELLRDRYVLANIAMSAVVMFCTDVLDGYLTEYCRGISIPDVAIGWIFSIYHITTCAIRPCLGIISKKIGLSRTFRVSLVFGGFSLVALGLAKSAWLLLGIIIIVGASIGFMNPITLLNVSTVAPPDKRSRVLSLRVVANAGAQTLGTNFYGFVVGLLGSYSPVFLISGGIMLLVTFLTRKYENRPAP
ncbi:MAG: MFS transporter [Eubacteriales bacterium]|jgi:MFS family permease